MNGPNLPHTFLAWLVSLLLLLNSGVAGEAARSPHPAARYRVIELPLLPLHISNSGEVVGSARGWAAIWSREHGLRQLPHVSGFGESEARDANRSGHIAGSAASSDRSRSRAFFFKDGKLTLLAGDGAKAVAINDSDEIVGEDRVAGKKSTSPVLWKAGAVIDLGACCGGTATGINDHGQVVGNMYDPQGRYQAFLWDQEHGIRSLGRASDGGCSAVAISEQGHVLVSEFDKGAFIYISEGQTVPLAFASNAPGKVRGMNAADTVVGAYGSFADAARAFIWDKGRGFQDLNGLIPANSGWTLESAISINDRGEIVGLGDHNDEEDTGFLLIPEPE